MCEKFANPAMFRNDLAVGRKMQKQRKIIRKAVKDHPRVKLVVAVYKKRHRRPVDAGGRIRRQSVIDNAVECSFKAMFGISDRKSMQMFKLFA